MKQNKNTTTAEISFPGLLTIAFIVLKLTGVIEWKWIWVLSPMWILALLTVLIVVIAILIKER